MTTINATMLARLSGTAAVAPDGMPLVLHHGTPHRFEQFGAPSGLGHHFGTRAQAQTREKVFRKNTPGPVPDGWRILSVALGIRNPLVLEWDPKDWTTETMVENWRDVIGDKSASRILAAHDHHLEQSRMEHAGQVAAARGIKAIRTVERDIWAAANPKGLALLRQALEAQGYDGIAYRNSFEGRGGISWVAFRPESILTVGQDVQADVVSAPRDVVRASGYVPGVHPLAPLRPTSRAPNRAPGAADFIRVQDAVNASFPGASEAFQPFVSYGTLVQPGCWKFPAGNGRLAMRMDNRDWRFGFQGCDGLEISGEIADAAGVAHDGRGYMTMEWSIGETPGEFAERIAAVVGLLRHELEANSFRPAPRI